MITHKQEFFFFFCSWNICWFSLLGTGLKKTQILKVNEKHTNLIHNNDISQTQCCNNKN